MVPSIPTTEISVSLSHPEKEGEVEWAVYISVKNETVLPSIIRITWGSTVVTVQGNSENFGTCQSSEAHPVKSERTRVSSGVPWEGTPAAGFAAEGHCDF